jgi:hypothetical protein
MTANQRRPGFRLPWSSETEGAMTDGEGAAEPATDEASAVASDAVNGTDTPAQEAATSLAEAAEPAAAVSPDEVVVGHTDPAPAPAAPVEAAAPAAPAASTPAAKAQADAPAEGDDFMRELVVAMRRVADEARETGMSDLMTRADEQVRTIESDAEKRRTDLRAASDADIAGIGEWSTAEAERIKREAEEKVVARKARLDQELAADLARTEEESKAVRARVADYERELEAYHAQLSEINDPAAFAAAAKRLPKPPVLGGSAVAAAGVAGAADATPDAGSNGAATSEVGSEALAARLAELDASLSGQAPAAAVEAPEADTTPEASADAPVQAAPEPEAAAEEPQAEAAVEPEAAPEPEAVAQNAAAEEPQPEAAAEPEAAPDAAAGPEAAAEPQAASAPKGDPVVTEVVVKGLGSFGAITGFRQSLSSVEGIDSVALSLGQTGEFVFRATHGAGFDVRAAIASLEGDGAKIENRPEGGLRVTLERAR